MQWTSPLRLGELEQLRRLARRHRERLLADDVLAGGEHLLRPAGSGGGSASSDGRRRRVVVASSASSESYTGASAFAAARSGDEPTTPGDLDAEQPQRIHVNDADEAGADDACPQRSEIRHLAIIAQRCAHVRRSRPGAVADGAVDRQSAVDEELLPCHVTRRVGDEEQCRVSNLGGVGDAAERNPLRVGGAPPACRRCG